MSAATLHPQAPTKRAASTVLGRLLVLLPPTAAIGSITVLIRPWRGIDLTDEMMYLLAASSGPMNFIHSPWGWHTGPLFRLVGQDVARFRVLGVVVLGLAAITLVLAARAFAMPEDSDAVGRSALAPLEIALLSAGAVFWAGLFYLGLLRSPGHNWVAVVGLTLAAAGMLRCLSAESAGRPTAVS